jgi:hypothetical protein
MIGQKTLLIISKRSQRRTGTLRGSTIVTTKPLSACRTRDLSGERVALMIDQIKEVHRLANDTGDPVVIERVSRFVMNGIA